MTTTTTEVRKGGAWLFEDTPAPEVFTPEKLTSEHRLIARTTEEFVASEVLPAVPRLEQRDWALARHLIRRCGELGLLGIGVPEEYGGLALDKATSVVVVERIARSASFATAFGGQANLGILPLVLFGTADQQSRYLPKLMSGELVAAYALSEPGSGSDAFAAKTRAVRDERGGWRLTGEKTWISNGGFADLLVVFAQVDGDRFTAFLVEKGYPGVSAGREEHKMGLHGSSTTPILLDDVHVPEGNVLGEIGKGHKVALNTLNYGRFSLGAMCAGGCRNAIDDAVRYASQRRQFGRPIAGFGAIRHKLGQMIARTYAAESLVYRTAGLLDRALESSPGDGAALSRTFEEYAIEASIAKVLCTEALDFVLDENVQIHGGNGFVSDYPAERYYRDARVNRIFEGTNEINRLLIPGMLVRRGLKGDLPLVAAAKRLQDEILAPAPPAPPADDATLDAELRTVRGFRTVALMVLGTAMQTWGDTLSEEQEVLGWTADILIETYAAESAVLRAQQASGADATLHAAAARVTVNGAATRVDAAAKSALAAMAEGDTLRTLLAALRRVLKPPVINTVALRRLLADESVARGRYMLGS